MSAKPVTPKGWQAFVLLCRVALTQGEERVRHAQRFLQVMEGDTFERGLQALLATPAGAELAARRPDSMSILRDRAALLACPPGSLGRRYAEFLAANGLDESYYTRTPLPETADGDRRAERHWFRARFEYAHDLRHVLSGYPASDLGEICLLSFRFGQTGNRGALFLALLGLLHRPHGCKAAFEAIARGRRARLLDLLAWEDRLAEPLSSIRAGLGVDPPRHFRASYAPEAYVETPSRGLAA